MTKQCNIQYIALNDNWRKEQKLQWFTENPFKEIPFTHIQPDKKNNWINIADNDFETLLPMADKAVKAGKSKKALFELFSLGASTNRDEWVIDISKEDLENKMSYFVSHLNNNKYDYSDNKIKWSRNLKRRLEQGRKEVYNIDLIKDINYRPFCKFHLYQSTLLIDEISSNNEIFCDTNLAFATMGISTDKPFTALGTQIFTDLNFLSPAACPNWRTV